MCGVAQWETRQWIEQMEDLSEDKIAELMAIQTIDCSAHSTRVMAKPGTEAVFHSKEQLAESFGEFDGTVESVVQGTHGNQNEDFLYMLGSVKKM